MAGVTVVLAVAEGLVGRRMLPSLPRPTPPRVRRRRIHEAAFDFSLPRRLKGRRTGFPKTHHWGAGKARARAYDKRLGKFFLHGVEGRPQ